MSTLQPTRPPWSARSQDSLRRTDLTSTRAGHIVLNGVTVEFPHRTGRGAAAVTEIDLEVHPGEFVCLLGPSGCGKSTLLNTVAGFVQSSAGQVTVDGAAVTRPGPERGMVFQQHSLFPWKTVQDNVAFGPRMAGRNRREAREKARELLELVGLSGYAEHYPSALSGGMQQRVGIARALANSPSVLLMDEPFGALDAQTRAMMQENLLEVWSRFNTTVLFVTHDIDEAIFLADRVVVMSAAPGRLIADLAVTLSRPRGPEVVTHPAFLDLKRQCLELIRRESLRSFQRGGQGGLENAA